MVGDEEFRITPFRAYKALLAGELLGSVSDIMRDLIDKVADFNAEYSEKHKLRVTRGMAAARATEEPAYGLLLEGPLKDHEFIEFPSTPGFEEQLLAVFSQGFKQGSKQLVEFVGLILIPNNDLRKAWREDRAFEAIHEFGADVFEKGDIGEVIQVVVTAVEVTHAQLAPYREAVGKLQALYRRAQETTTEPEEATTEATTPIDSIEPSLESSIDSQELTDGTTSEPSSVPVGVSSSTSPTSSTESED